MQEESSHSEYAANSAAERAIPMVMDQLRTMTHALAHRQCDGIRLGHPIMRWLVDLAALLWTHVHVSPEDGRTGYE